MTEEREKLGTCDKGACNGKFRHAKQDQCVNWREQPAQAVPPAMTFQQTNCPKCNHRFAAEVHLGAGDGEGISAEQSPLSYEQEVHAVLHAAASNTEDLIRYFEAQYAQEKGEAKKLTEKCIAWKRDDLRRISALIPQALKAGELRKERDALQAACVEKDVIDSQLIAKLERAESALASARQLLRRVHEDHTQSLSSGTGRITECDCRLCNQALALEGEPGEPVEEERG